MAIEGMPNADTLRATTRAPRDPRGGRVFGGVGGFADARLATMSAGELETFETLLDQVDHDLWSWIAGQAEAPPAFQGPLLEQIRAFRFTLPGPHGDTTRA